MIDWVTKQIQSEWSPDQVAGLMRRVGSIQVSHQWIYNLIYRDKIAGDNLWKYCRLPCQRRYQRHLAKRAGLGKIPDRVGIERRPKAVDDRLHIGHWEGGTILHGHKNSGAITLVERRTGYSGSGYQFSLNGYFGLMASIREGVELNILGLNIGIDPLALAVKLPGIARGGTKSRLSSRFQIPIDGGNINQASGARFAGHTAKLKGHWQPHSDTDMIGAE